LPEGAVRDRSRSDHIKALHPDSSDHLKARPARRQRSHQRPRSTGRFGRFLARNPRPDPLGRCLWRRNSALGVAGGARRDVTGIPVSVLPSGT